MSHQLRKFAECENSDFVWIESHKWQLNSATIQAGRLRALQSSVFIPLDHLNRSDAGGVGI